MIQSILIPTVLKMDRLAGLDKYFKEKDRKKLDKIAAETNPLGTPTMSKEEIRQSCVENGGYETAELNDKLYLHFRGFKKIENLEAYTGCKAIWLDSNGLACIEGLDALVQVRCLYMSKNLISTIENLSNLKELIQLDLSSNRITKIEGLSSLPHLDSLNLSRNALTTVESIAHLKECPSLRTLDLQNNRLEADEAFIDLFASMPVLATLQINGNETTKVPTFRKKMIHRLPQMGYLDRPVDEQERLAANAFMVGGAEAEKEAREQWRVKVQQDRKDQMTSFRQWQKEQQALRAAMPQEQRARLEVDDSLRAEAREAAAAENAAIEQRAVREVGVIKISQRMAELEAKGITGATVMERAHRELLQELDEEKAARAGWSHRVEEVDTDGNALPPPAPVAGRSSTNFDELDEDEDIDTESTEYMPARRSREPLTGSIPGYENAPRVTLSKPSYSIASSADEGRQLSEYSQHASAMANANANSATYEQVQEPEQDDGQDLELEPDVVETAAEAALREALETAAKNAASEALARKKQEQQEEDARQQRVAESVAMYKAQKAAAATAKNSLVSVNVGPKAESSWDSAVGLTAGAGGSLASTTTDLPATSSHADDASDVIEVPESAAAVKALYWSEEMDVLLAKQVQACVFDFVRVSEEMLRRFSNASLTEEACRLRWADLDAGDQNALETNFTCYVTDNIITKGHGAQPSFDSLSSMSRGQFPAYLKAPNAFPSVADLSDDSDADDDKENGTSAGSRVAQIVEGI